jgi:hypothetical protein
MAGNQSGALKPVDEFNCTVMFQLHAFGQVANGRAQVRRETFNGEQQVALSRVNACVVSRHFAEVQLGDYGEGK